MCCWTPGERPQRPVYSICVLFQRVHIAGQAPSAILTFSSGVAVLHRRVNKAKAPPALTPFLQRFSSCSLDFLTHTDLKGEPLVELSSLGITLAWVFGSAWDRTLESFWVRSVWVCMCASFVLGRASRVLYICHFLPGDSARKVSLVFTSIRTLQETEGWIYSHQLGL